MTRDRMLLRFLFLVLLHLLLPFSLFPQSKNIMFEHYTIEHGLSAPVTHIAQDKHGFMWFGTMDGLNRFDGINFIVYRNIPGDSNSLPSNIINALYVDEKGKIWVATNGGLCYYHFDDDRFHRIHYDQSLESLDRHRVHGVSGTPDGSIWFATRTILHELKDEKPGRLIYIPPSESLVIKDLYIDPMKRKWIGTSDGIYMHDDRTGKLLQQDLTSPFSIENNLATTVHPIVHYMGDTLLTGTWYAGLQKVYSDGTKIINQPIIDIIETDPRRHIVSGIAKDNENRWWIGTYGNGLAWLDPETNIFLEHFHHNPSDSRSLGNDYINDIFTDASGIVWIGTSKGLDKFDPLTQQFNSVTLPLPPDQFAVYRIPNTIVEDPADQDWLWICVSGVGLLHYHKLTQQFELVKLNEKGTDARLSNNVYSFYADRQGRIWVGTRLGVHFFDLKSKKISDAPLAVHQKVKGAHTIHDDGKGNIWFATHAYGIYKYNESADQLTSFTYDPREQNSLPDNRVFCMTFDTKGRIWIGTQNRGLCRLDPGTGDFIFFMNTKNDPNSIPDNGVFDLYEDDTRHIWIATENGLAKMDMESFRITNYNTNHGLSNNTVYSITPDGEGYLWLGTNNGLSKLDMGSETFHNYYMSDGLPHNRITGDVFYGSDRSLYFGTTDMLTICKPGQMKKNQQVPSIVITDYTILGKEVPVMRNGAMLLPIDLSYKQNMITFNFAALNFSNPALNQYAYKLEGFDEDWIDCGHKQSATYTNLNGGTYVFRVKGANNDGLWNETGSSVVLRVHPPFWKTWWFILLLALAITGLLYAYYRIRINQLMRLQLIRARIARDLHDDIGSTLSSINMISSMADQKEVPATRSGELFHTISQASGQAMDLMSDIVWSINPKNDRMEMIITRMRQYASEILEAANISFDLEVDEKNKEVLLPLEIRKDFYLIFKEAINNVAKYSRAAHVTIRLDFRDHVIRLLIKDNGVGFDPLSTDHGNGLRNMKARAEHLRGKITIDSVRNHGTTVDLLIPLSP